MEEIQNGSALASDGAVESVPNGPMHGVVNRVQAGDRNQRAGRAAQFRRKVKFPVIGHFSRKRLFRIML